MAFLKLMNGEERGRVNTIDREMILGRSPKCDIQYTDPTVSRRHAQITLEESTFFIEDLNSQHGTVLDGKRINQREPIPDGALIEMGSCNVVFDSGNVPAPQPTSVPGSRPADEPSSGTAILDAMAAIESHRQSNDHKLRAVLEIMHNVGISLDIETIFPKILESMLILFPNAERACIQLVDGPGPLRLAASWGRGGSEPEFPLSKTLIQGVLERGQAILSDDALEDSRFDSDSVYNLDLRSLMCAPLVSEDEPVGLIYIDSKHTREPFQSEDLHVLITIANLAAHGLGRAQLHAARVAFEKHQQDLQLARDLQLHFLPRELPKVEQYQLATHYEAALNVGGDYLGCLPLDDGRIGLIVADVAGKGMSAALIMARLCSDVRYGLSRHPEAADAVKWLSEQMLEADEYGRFVTMALGILDPETHQVQIANAGHPPPLLRSADGIRTWSRQLSGPPLGVIHDAEYQQEAWELAPGDCLLLHSDGANEAESGDGELFGLARVADSLLRSTTAEDAVSGLRDEVQEFLDGGAQPDDICILAAARLPADA